MKQRIIPSRLTAYASDDNLGIAIYANFEPTERCQCEAMAFVGKAIKPTWYYGFKSKEQLDQKINELFAQRNSYIAYKQEQKAKRKAAAATIKVEVGDVFVSTWGYDQTNVDYYQVVAVSGQMATVRAIKGEGEDDGFMTGKCVPVPDQFCGEPRRVKLQKYSDSQSGASFKVNSYAYAYQMQPVAKIGNKAIYQANRYSYYA
jgi:hypothetical protein